MDIREEGINSKGRNKSMRDNLWSSYWAEQGLAVIHVDRLKIVEGELLEDRIMRVERIVMESKEGEEGDRRKVMRGIICHWVDKENRMWKEMFHSRELVPYEVARKGLGEVQRWIEREVV